MSDKKEKKIVATKKIMTTVTAEAEAAIADGASTNRMFDRQQPRVKWEDLELLFPPLVATVETPQGRTAELTVEVRRAAYSSSAKLRAGRRLANGFIGQDTWVDDAERLIPMLVEALNTTRRVLYEEAKVRSEQQLASMEAKLRHQPFAGMFQPPTE